MLDHKKWGNLDNMSLADDVVRGDYIQSIRVGRSGNYQQYDFSVPSRQASPLNI